MQRRILQKNFFVERFLFPNVLRTLSEEEKDHYRKVQPTPELRTAVAQGPRQIAAAAPWLAELEGRVQRRLSSKPVLVTFPMADRAFPAKTTLPRFRATFSDIQIVELPGIKHFFLEDESPAVAEAIRARFT